MPQTTAPIGSLIGKMFGRSARSTRTSACMPTSSEPVTPRSPAATAPSLVAKRMTLRVVISFGTPPLPASLRSNTVACCIEIAARICANRSPGATRTSSTARPGRTSLSIRCWIGGDPEPPVISLTGAIEIAAPEDAIASTSVAESSEPWTTVTSSPRRPRSDAAEMVSFALACTWMRRPSSRADAHAAAAPSEATPWAIAPNAIVVDGPARSRRRAARPRRRRRRVDEHGANARVRVRAGARPRRGRRVPRRTSRRRW